MRSALADCGADEVAVEVASPPAVVAPVPTLGPLGLPLLLLTVVLVALPRLRAGSQ